MLSCQFCKHVGKIWVLLVSCLPKKCSLINTFRLVAWDKPSQTAADSVDWKNSYTPDVDHETAGAGACVKALDSRHIVCFEAVIYELLVAKSKLTDHRVFDDFSSLHLHQSSLRNQLIWIWSWNRLDLNQKRAMICISMPNTWSAYTPRLYQSH